MEADGHTASCFNHWALIEFKRRTGSSPRTAQSLPRLCAPNDSSSWIMICVQSAVWPHRILGYLLFSPGPKDPKLFFDKSTEAVFRPGGPDLVGSPLGGPGILSRWFSKRLRITLQVSLNTGAWLFFSTVISTLDM